MEANTTTRPLVGQVVVYRGQPADLTKYGEGIVGPERRAALLELYVLGRVEGGRYTFVQYRTGRELHTADDVDWRDCDFAKKLRQAAARRPTGVDDVPDYCSDTGHDAVIPVFERGRDVAVADLVQDWIDGKSRTARHGAVQFDLAVGAGLGNSRIVMDVQRLSDGHAVTLVCDAEDLATSLLDVALAKMDGKPHAVGGAT